jgi:hypothetical protein
MKNPFGPDPESFHSYMNLKKRMFSQILRLILEDMLKKLDPKRV